MEPYIKGRKTLKNPSIRASVQPSSLKARETRNLIRGNRNGRVRRDNEVKERLGNNSPRVRAPNAVGCVSLKELKSLNSLSFLTFHLVKSPQKWAFLLAGRGGTQRPVFPLYHTASNLSRLFFVFFRVQDFPETLHHAKVLKRFSTLKHESASPC